MMLNHNESFEKLIIENKSKEYIHTAKNRKTEFLQQNKMAFERNLIFEKDIFEDCISSSDCALQIVFELEQTSYSFIRFIFRNEFSHKIANQYNSFSHKERTDLIANIESYIKEHVSNIFTVAIINHEVVRYYLLSRPEAAANVYAQLNESDLKVLDREAMEFMKEYTTKVSSNQKLKNP